MQSSATKLPCARKPPADIVPKYKYRREEGGGRSGEKDGGWRKKKKEKEKEKKAGIILLPVVRHSARAVESSQTAEKEDREGVEKGGKTKRKKKKKKKEKKAGIISVRHSARAVESSQTGRAPMPRAVRMDRYAGALEHWRVTMSAHGENLFYKFNHLENTKI